MRVWHRLCSNLCMKTALSIWDHRIAPVFDTARQLHLVESDGERVEKESAHTLSGDELPQKVAWLAEQGVETLVCGAVSRLFQEQLEAAGIKVIPFVAGGLRQVMQAYLSGTLKRATFMMPGCCGRRHRSCAGRCNTQAKQI